MGMSDAQWPTVEEAVKRLAIRIGDHSSTDVVEVNAADLIVAMRELGRLTAEAKQRSQPRVGIYERLEELEAENAKLKAALKPFAEIPITAPEGTDWWQAAVSLHSSDLRRVRAALATARQPQGSGA